MKEKSEINYIGDNDWLDTKMVSNTAIKVIKNHWKLPGKPPEEFKLDINVVSDSEIKKINKEYLKRNRATDVIAFSLEEGEYVPESNVPLIGQIIISRDAAKRQAKDYNHSIKNEMTILLIHGLLHVAGWKEGVEIQSWQEKIKKILKKKKNK